MSASDSTDKFAGVQKQVIELVIQLGVLFILLFWCFSIIRPFLLIVIWGVIVAIALYPVFEKLAAAARGREKMTSIVLVLALISILVVPAAMLTESLFTGARMLADAGEAGELSIPLPPESVAGWPLVGDQVYEYWSRAAENLPELLGEFAPQIRAFGSKLLEIIGGTGLGILQFIASFIITGVLLAKAHDSAQAAEAFTVRLVGAKGPELSALATGTIRNVALGIVGVSIVQTALLSVGFMAIGLPAAGLVALLALVLCIIQVGPALVTLPAIIYVFSTADTTPAVLFTIWTVIMTLIDSVLKPIVFGRGASVPTIIIFLGAIGGMLTYGIIGLFIGAVILSVGFKLYQAWLEDTPMAVSTTD